MPLLSAHSVPVPCPPHRGGARASLTEHEKLEVPLRGTRRVLRPAGVEARIARLDPGEVEGPGLVQEAVAVPLGDLGREVRGSW